MVSMILHLCLVILSEAKDLFQVSKITDKTVIQTARSYCPPLADQDLPAPGP